MQKPKKLTAMDLLVNSASLKPAMSQDNLLSRKPIANLQNGVPVEISPDACRPWRLADRPLNETRHKDELVKSFQDGGVGQIQPIVVRQVQDAEAPGIEYEIICGRVRWLAAQALGIPVQAIVRELSDQEAYVLMSTENKQRRNLSDYAKAKSYQQALGLGIFDTAQALADADGISKSKLSLYLGFAELPIEVVEAFADMTKVPYRLGYELNKTCKAIGIEETLKLIPSIESGDLSRTDVQNLQANVIQSTATANANANDAAAKADVPTQAAEATHQLLPLENKISAPQDPGPNELPEARTSAYAIVDAPSPVKHVFLSASGQKLFTYNNASRGLLIRVAPEISVVMGEAFMQDLGKLIEAYCRKAV